LHNKFIEADFSYEASPGLQVLIFKNKVNIFIDLIRLTSTSSNFPLFKKKKKKKKGGELHLTRILGQIECGLNETEANFNIFKQAKQKVLFDLPIFPKKKK